MVLHKFISGEGHYAITYEYHMRLLLRFEAKMTLNFPFFMMKSLQKMSSQVLKNKKNTLTSLHHQSLIKILICFKLQQCHDTWENSLERNQFKTPAPSTNPTHRQKVLAALNEEVDPLESSKSWSPESADDMARFMVKH